MPEQPTMVVLPGSTRRALPNSRVIAKSNPQERIRISVFVRRYRRHPDADPADLVAVCEWCESNQLKVLDSSIPMHRVMAEGAIGEVQRAFQIELNEYEHPKHGFFRGREGDLHVPRRLARVVTGVFGLEARRLSRTPFPHPAMRTLRAAAG
jgi:kumamolisin